VAVVAVVAEVPKKLLSGVWDARTSICMSVVCVRNSDQVDFEYDGDPFGVTAY